MGLVLEDRVGLGSRANPGECQELSPGWLDWAGCLADDGPTGKPYRSATMRASRLDVRASQAMGRLLRAQKELLSFAAEQRRIGLEMKLAMNSLYGKIGSPRRMSAEAAITRLVDRGDFYVDTDRVR